MKETAGTLLFRYRKRQLEVLLVHAAGNYNKDSPWSIPKGLPERDEDFEAAARRETWEETGVIAGDLTPLGFIEYTRSKKRIHCFAGKAPDSAKPNCASYEVDRAEFLQIDDAKRLIHPDQFPLLQRLEHWLKKAQHQQDRPGH